MTAVTETELYDNPIDLDALEQRWGSEEKGILSTLYTEEQLARQSTIDVPALIADVRKAREALVEARATAGDPAVAAELAVVKAANEAFVSENEALKQANADARNVIRELRAEVESLKIVEPEK